MINNLNYNTKLPITYQQAFLKEVDCGLNNNKKENLKKQQHCSKLLKRKNYLNNRFVFNNENVLKYEALSLKLTAIQANTIVKLNVINENIKVDLITNENLFTDYNICLNIQFHCNSIADTVDVLYQTDSLIYNNLEDLEYLEFINKNYASIESHSNYKRQFSHFHQCRLFHHLICESHLALQDILLIDTIWYDITVDYQTKYNLK